VTSALGAVGATLTGPTLELVSQLAYQNQPTLWAALADLVPRKGNKMADSGFLGNFCA